MKRLLWLSVLLTLGMGVLIGCQKATPTPTEPMPPVEEKATEAPQEQPAEAPQAKEIVLTVGFTESKTGKLNVSSSRQSQGLRLWMKQINQAGGIQLGDGTVVKFQEASYDDESSKDRVQELYTKLITENNADFLISPYSSGLTAAAAVIAEQYEKVMITTGAASDSIYQQGYMHVFQIYTPASRYLTGAIDMLKETDPNLKKVAFVYEQAKFATAVVEAAKAYAEGQGYEVVLFEGYPADTTDFGPFINKIVESGAEAVLGGGHFQDGSTFARQLHEKQAPVKAVVLLVAPPEPEFAELGEAAFGIIGPSQWEPQVQYTPEAAKELGIEWYGPSNEEFIQAYEAEYNEEPSYHSAGGYAAGIILEYAIKKADSVDPQKVKAALEATDVLTFFGRIKFDTSAEAHGLQIGHEMVYIQWQKDDQGNLVKQVVWPKEGATAELIYPLPR